MSYGLGYSKEFPSNVNFKQLANEETYILGARKFHTDSTDLLKKTRATEMKAAAEDGVDETTSRM